MKKWVYCKNCKHKLFLADMSSRSKIEIKCHSCKMINAVTISNGKILAEIKEDERQDG